MRSIQIGFFSFCLVSIRVLVEGSSSRTTTAKNEFREGKDLYIVNDGQRLRKSLMAVPYQVRYVDCDPVCESIEYAAVTMYSRNGSKVQLQAQPMGFGASTTGFKSTAVLSEPRDACTMLSVDLTKSMPASAVIQRGGCEFSTKVDNALRAGAQSIIFVNNDETNVFTHIYCPSNDNPVNIPLLILPKESGQVMLNILMDKKAENTTWVSPFKPLSDMCDGSDSGISREAFAFFWQAGVFLALVVLAGLCFINRVRYMRMRMFGNNYIEEDDEEDREEFRVLQEEDMARFRTIIYERPEKQKRSESGDESAKEEGVGKDEEDVLEEEEDDSREMCSICLDNFENGDKQTTLPCGHAFHMACVRTWLTEHSIRCPLCKRDVSKSLLANIDEEEEEGDVAPRASSSGDAEERFEIAAEENIEVDVSISDDDDDDDGVSPPAMRVPLLA